MSSYYVNTQAQTNGDHEVHKDGCNFAPNATNRKYLGEFELCVPAVQEARKHFQKVNGCYFCARPCHTT